MDKQITIAVRDPSLIKEVLKEQERRGDGNRTKTLADLARERLAQLEAMRERHPAVAG